MYIGSRDPTVREVGEVADAHPRRIAESRTQKAHFARSGRVDLSVLTTVIGGTDPEELVGTVIDARGKVNQSPSVGQRRASGTDAAREESPRNNNASGGLELADLAPVRRHTTEAALNGPRYEPAPDLRGVFVSERVADPVRSDVPRGR